VARRFERRGSVPIYIGTGGCTVDTVRRGGARWAASRDRPSGAVLLRCQTVARCVGRRRASGARGNRPGTEKSRLCQLFDELTTHGIDAGVHGGGKRPAGSLSLRRVTLPRTTLGRPGARIQGGEVATMAVSMPACMVAIGGARRVSMAGRVQGMA
jgi:hypothetical protein